MSPATNAVIIAPCATLHRAVHTGRVGGNIKHALSVSVSVRCKHDQILSLSCIYLWHKAEWDRAGVSDQKPGHAHHSPAGSIGLVEADIPVEEISESTSQERRALPGAAGEATRCLVPTTCIVVGSAGLLLRAVRRPQAHNVSRGEKAVHLLVRFSWLLSLPFRYN